MQKESEGVIHDKELPVALIHADILWKDKRKNIAKLLTLNEEAAAAGTKIILNTEMATTGYAFENRTEVASLAEIIPGPTTEAFGQITKKYGCYICIGLPEVDALTGIFYNAAALIGPSGNVIAKHRKLAPAFRENLWAARGNLSVPVVQTKFGKLGIMICADTYSYRPARIAALQGARLLLVPANWTPEHHNPENFWRARAAENGVYMMACNRTGKDKKMDCRTAESFIIDPQGEVVKKTRSPEDTVIYGTIPLENGNFVSMAAEDILNRRKPGYYGNISLDTFTQFNPEMLLNLPKAADFTVATGQFRPVPGEPVANTQKMLKLIDEAVSMAAAQETSLDLIVFPELSTTGIIYDYREAEKYSEEIPGPTIEIFAGKAKEKDLFIVLGMAERRDEKFFNTSVLIGPNGVEGTYRKIHLNMYDQKWAQPGKGGFPTFDLPFGRIGMLIGYDLMFPEGNECLAKWGADLVCIPALWDCKNKFIWQARLAEQMHLAVANQWGNFVEFHALGKSSIYSYSRYPEKRRQLESSAEGNEIKIMCLSTKEVREKRFLENIDYEVLLGSLNDKKII